MRHFTRLLWLSGLTLLSAQALLASTVQVGTCDPNLQSFSTISAAVSGVPAGSTIEVCPGTYAEQVTITQALNLTGVASGTANQAVITVPSAGLLPNTTSMFGESVAAQILVLAGPVSITNLAVDGTGGDMACNGNIWVAGIFYGSGSSGTVNQVRASNQVDGSCGVGIWAENANAPKKPVTVRNSSVYNVDSSGIFVGSGTPPSLAATINNNVVNASAAVAAIDSDSVTGQVMANNISNTLFGLFDTAGLNMSANTIMGTTYGIFLGGLKGVGGKATGNQISGSSYGLLLGATSTTLSNNRIFSSMTAGVELGCFAANVSGNLINDAPVGIDSASATPLGPNTFANTATTIVSGTCAAAAPLLRTTGAMTTTRATTIVREQWRTPATPFGTRTK